VFGVYNVNKQVRITLPGRLPAVISRQGENLRHRLHDAGI